MLETQVQLEPPLEEELEQKENEEITEDQELMDFPDHQDQKALPDFLDLTVVQVSRDRRESQAKMASMERLD